MADPTFPRIVHWLFVILGILLFLGLTAYPFEAGSEIPCPR